MKRALAVALLGLAACSSGGSGGIEAVQAPRPTTTEATTTTTTAPVAGLKAKFLASVNERLATDDPTFPEAAYDMATSMCDLLDSTVAGPAADDAENDSVQTDAVISATLTGQALEVASGTGLDPAVNATWMRIAADVLCPQHLSVVYDYTREML